MAFACQWIPTFHSGEIRDDHKRFERGYLSGRRGGAGGIRLVESVRFDFDVDDYGTANAALPFVGSLMLGDSIVVDAVDGS